MSTAAPTRPTPFTLIVAAIFPATVIVIERLIRLCAESLFDPLPTIGHIVLVSAVPIVNVLLWRAVRSGAAPRLLIVAGGAASAIAAAYTMLFVPVMPIAIVGILFVGIGLLPFAPLGALVFALRWTLSLARQRQARRLALAGGVAGIVALALIDLPASVTRIALDRYARTGEDRASAVRLMRLGDRDLLLRYASGDILPPAGVFPFVVGIWNDGVFGQRQPSTEAARELYYRTTGQAFNAAPRTDRHERRFAWDEDRAGDAVGGRIADLSLGGSRIDGSVNERDSLAYLEWTFDIANRSSVAQEARFTLALPEGAVVSRATLWVNGEPREASIAGRGAVTAAYRNVVRASRDPLLVTTDGAQRLLVQAFPVPVDATMRLRIGVTAPFAIAADGARTLALPRIVERNFDIDRKLAHAVWIEGGRPLRTALDDATLLAAHQHLSLPPITAPRTTIATLAASGKAGPIAVEQRIEPTMAGQGPLILVVDASADMAATLGMLDRALPSIAARRIVGMVVAGEKPTVVAPAPWSIAQARRMHDVLAKTTAQGGQDDRAALALALRAIPRADATILWLHGVQPVRFADPDPALEQALDRLPALPRLVRYQAVPGRALIVAGERWFDAARLPSPSGDTSADLRALLASGPAWRIERRRTSPGTPEGSSHLVRLWAAGELAGLGEAPGKRREAAITLAHRLNIVTPVSGAVVLETDAEYKNGDLPVPDPDAVPTVPEPETWALLILATLAAFWLWRRQRLVVAA